MCCHPAQPRAKPVPDRPGRPWARLLLVAWLLTLGACGSLPVAVERPQSFALGNPASTSLGRQVQGLRHQVTQPGQGTSAGFVLLDSAEQAFAARLALIAAAERTLDIQYYAIHADGSTHRLLAALRAAAARGVRIRILLDDFNSAGPHAQVLQLAFEPHIELRLFNPLPGPRHSLVLRVLRSLGDVPRIQRRMHNKIMVADNAVAIVGGRNLGEAYFGQGRGSHYIDIDVLAAGSVVQELSRSFDQYWNNMLAYPATALVTPGELQAIAQLAPPVGHEEAASPIPGATASEPLPLERLTWAPALVLTDRPSKLVRSQDEVHQAQDSVIDGLLHLLASARHDVVIVSPYFVPGPRIMGALQRLSQRQVRVRVLTNSLASNDAPAAHVGYARHRQALLAAGVELFEMRAEQPAALRLFGSAAPSRASLHSKLVVMDGQLLVTGSMNLDLRSQLQNTEVALLIHSPHLARQATERIEDTLSTAAYQVRLDQGQLRWRPPQGDGPDHHAEPDASPGLKLLIQLLRPFSPDEML